MTTSAFIINSLILFSFYLAICYSIAKFSGTHRQIGFKRSLLFSVALTPIIGFFITIFTKNSETPAPKPSLSKKIIGWFLVVIGILIFGSSLNPSDAFIYHQPSSLVVLSVLQGVILSAGVMAYGTFLVGRANSNRYDGTT